ncbi:MAG: hypothetical protein NT006_08020, partial [Candidatus Aminicenantes bacterium]|nr:hypothetical protein [Candidatus Aminicenantes bacterium]
MKTRTNKVLILTVIALSLAFLACGDSGRQKANDPGTQTAAAETRPGLGEPPPRTELALSTGADAGQPAGAPRAEQV